MNSARSMQPQFAWTAPRFGQTRAFAPFAAVRRMDVDVFV
jgi:hypothetical protein